MNRMVNDSVLTIQRLTLTYQKIKRKVNIVKTKYTRDRDDKSLYINTNDTVEPVSVEKIVTYYMKNTDH